MLFGKLSIKAGKVSVLVVDGNEPYVISGTPKLKFGGIAINSAYFAGNVILYGEPVLKTGEPLLSVLSPALIGVVKLLSTNKIMGVVNKDVINVGILGTPTLLIGKLFVSHQSVISKSKVGNKILTIYIKRVSPTPHGVVVYSCGRDVFRTPYGYYDNVKKNQNLYDSQNQ